MIDQARLEKIKAIRIRGGASDAEATDAATDAACVMQLVAYVAGEWEAGKRLTDHPECACPALTAVLISWNDHLRDDDERATYLRDLIPLVAGTRGSSQIKARRRYALLDWSWRVAVPAIMRAAGNNKAALKFEELPPIVDGDSLALALARTTALRNRIRQKRRDARDQLRAAVIEKLRPQSDVAAHVTDAAIAAHVTDAAIAAAAAHVAAAHAYTTVADAFDVADVAFDVVDVVNAVATVADAADYSTRWQAAYGAACKILDARLGTTYLAKIEAVRTANNVGLHDLIVRLCAMTEEE